MLLGGRLTPGGGRPSSEQPTARVRPGAGPAREGVYRAYALFSPRLSAVPASNIRRIQGSSRICLPTLRIAERHPGLKLIIDHLGRPARTKDAAAWANLAEMLALARRPNIAIKATGAPSYSSEPYPYRNIHDHLRRIYDAFGPQRMFWGTDITGMPCSWRQCVTMFTEELPWLSTRDKELIMGQAVCQWLDWTLLAR